MTFHVENVTNLIISTESLTGSNIEVRHSKNESSMIMDRAGTRTSGVLHKVARVPWLKLRRDDSVLDSDLRIAAFSLRPMGIEEIDPEEMRQARLRKKKETLEMDESMEVRKTHSSANPDARGSTDPIPQPVETSIAQRSTLDLVLWSDEHGGLLEPAQEERRRPRTSSQTQASETGAVIACTVRLEVGPGQNLKHGSHAETCWMRPRENKHTKRDPVSACQDQGMGSKHCGLLRMESSACTSESRRYPSQSRSEHSKSRDCVKNFKECCWWRWQRARTMRCGCM